MWLPWTTCLHLTVRNDSLQSGTTTLASSSACRLPNTKLGPTWQNVNAKWMWQLFSLQDDMPWKRCHLWTSSKLWRMLCFGEDGSSEAEETTAKKNLACETSVTNCLLEFCPSACCSMSDTFWDDEPSWCHQNIICCRDHSSWCARQACHLSQSPPRKCLMIVNVQEVVCCSALFFVWNMPRLEIFRCRELKLGNILRTTCTLQLLWSTLKCVLSTMNFVETIHFWLWG